MNARSAASSAILEGMMNEVIGRKKGEAPAPQPAVTRPEYIVVNNASFPNDLPIRTTLDTIGLIRHEAEKIIAWCADVEGAMAALVNAVTPPPASPEAVAEMMAAAAPTGPMVPEREPNPIAVGLMEDMMAGEDGKIGWTCPDHGEVTIKTSARTGREYRACPVAGCLEIERVAR